MATVINGNFEWDADKAASNLVKHGVSFEEAMTVLVSEETAELADPTSPENVITIGFSGEARVLLVVSCERDYVEGPEGKEKTVYRTRIISARPADKRERALFNER